MKREMPRALVLVIAAASCTFAQERGDVIYQTAGQVAIAGGAFDKASGPVVGAPYSATITNESVQTLSDGNRIVQSSTGTTARDSRGRTRQDAPLPPIGNLSAANAPHLVFIMDPLAQVSYTLNLSDKTAEKISVPSGAPGPAAATAGARQLFVTQSGAVQVPDAPPPSAIAMVKSLGSEEHAEV